MPYTCIIIEDDAATGILVENLLSQTGRFELLKIFSEPIKALNYLRDISPDIIFLDIELPQLSGFEFAKMVNNDSKIIVHSSKRDYAFEAFDIRAFDFIEKPMTLPKLTSTIMKLDALNTNVKNTDNFFFIKTNKEYVKVKISDILYIQSINDYVSFTTKNEQLITRDSLKRVLEYLNSDNFIQIHKSYIVNKDYIDKFDNDRVFVNNEPLPLSKRRKSYFFEQMNYRG